MSVCSVVQYIQRTIQHDGGITHRKLLGNGLYAHALLTKDPGGGQVGGGLSGPVALMTGGEGLHRDISDVQELVEHNGGLGQGDRGVRLKDALAAVGSAALDDSGHQGGGHIALAPGGDGLVVPEAGEGHVVQPIQPGGGHSQGEKLRTGDGAVGLVEVGSAVAGTHTHVQTADACVLAGGTGYITDLGMCGSGAGVLGVKTECILRKFLSPLPVTFEAAEGELSAAGAVFTVELPGGRCTAAEGVKF